MKTTEEIIIEEKVILLKKQIMAYSGGCGGFVSDEDNRIGCRREYLCQKCRDEIKRCEIGIEILEDLKQKIKEKKCII